MLAKFPWCRDTIGAPWMSHIDSRGFGCFFVALPLSISKISYSTMGTVSSSKVAGAALCCDRGFFLPRRLIHLCADDTVARKREEGELMLR